LDNLALIAARAENGVIGRNGMLPWRIPADMRYFKSVTMGKPVVMGRKTFASIGRPLPGRQNIVITRSVDFSHAGVTVAMNLPTAIALSASAAAGGEIMVIGGAAIYEAALPFARRLYMTEVHGEFDGDVHFPWIDTAEWIELSREKHVQDQPMPIAFSFVVMDRRA
jgi:dihydrofolate reductase